LVGHFRCISIGLTIEFRAEIPRVAWGSQSNQHLEHYLDTQYKCTRREDVEMGFSVAQTPLGLVYILIWPRIDAAAVLGAESKAIDRDSATKLR